ncbi:MAG: beta strand repeat-containing protein, partial [Acetobacteraceae bacterium]
VVLNAGTGGIALTGSALLGYGSGGLVTVDLTTAGGGVTEAGSARLSAAYLQSTGSVVGTVALAGATNAIGQIDGFVVSGGDLTLIEQGNQPLTVAGSVSAAGHTIGIGADGLTLASGGSLAAATVAIAPVTPGTTVTLGTGGTGLTLPGSVFAQIDAGRIDIGSLDGGSTITAGAVSINTGISLASATTLGLYSLGTIAENGTGSLIADGLVGFGALGAGLEGANTIGAIGSFGVGAGQTLDINDTVSNITLTSTGGGGAFIFTDPGGTVTLAGTLGGQSITIDPAVIDVTGTLTANAITLDAGSTIGTAGTILLESTSALLPGATGSVELSVFPGASNAVGAGVSQQMGGVISAGTLFSVAGVSGMVDLAGTANAIGQISGFVVSGGDFKLADSGAGTLTLASTLSADNVMLGGTIGAPGSIVLNGGTITLNSGGTTIALGAGAGGIAFDGTALVNAGTAGTLALGAGAGGITQSASAVIMAGSLLGNGAITGPVALVGSNTIATLGSLTVTGADFTLADGGQAGALSVAGPVSAVDVTIGGGTLSPGTLLVPGTIVTTGSLLSLDAGAGGMSLDGSLNAAGTLALGAIGGGVTETGTIVAATLVSLGTVTGTVDLTGSNTIASIGDFSGPSAAQFILADAGASNLTVFGTLVSGGVTLGAGATPPAALTVTGTVGVNSAPGTVVLNAGTGGIALTGSALLGYGSGGLVTVGLTTAGGGVTEADSARLSAAYLQSTGSVVGTVALAGANTIAHLGSFTASGSFVLDAAPGTALDVIGAVQAGAG